MFIWFAHSREGLQFIYGKIGGKGKAYWKRMREETAEMEGEAKDKVASMGDLEVTTYVKKMA